MLADIITAPTSHFSKTYVGKCNPTPCRRDERDFHWVCDFEYDVRVDI